MMRFSTDARQAAQGSPSAQAIVTDSLRPHTRTGAKIAAAQQLQSEKLLPAHRLAAGLRPLIGKLHHPMRCADPNGGY
ncbi:hypothetical protein [Glutamicibacter sp. JC586]|uniref:hypothetical protein n=1 Tax=Glutamicibacter sp. JC586 TaxID=2590552 RepID=UPI001359B5A1|nr:hypothetical protein [Glutamicibacter sp. JC586]